MMSVGVHAYVSVLTSPTLAGPDDEEPEPRMIDGTHVTPLNYN